MTQRSRRQTGGAGRGAEDCARHRRHVHRRGRHRRGGRRFALKTPSTPADPSIGLLDGIRKAAEAADRDEGAVARLLHGSTTATNAVLEHRFEELGLIVTKGFRHIIEIARQSVPDGYGHSFLWVKPPRRTSWPRWGDALRREPALVCRDVECGLVSVAAARAQYGVVVTGGVLAGR